MRPHTWIVMAAMVLGGLVLTLLLRTAVLQLMREPSPRPVPVASPPPDKSRNAPTWTRDAMPVDRHGPRQDETSRSAPHQEARAPVATDDSEPADVYESCDTLEGEAATACTTAIDDRIDALQEACSKYEDEEGDRWQECMDAAHRAQPY